MRESESVVVQKFSPRATAWVLVAILMIAVLLPPLSRAAIPPPEKLLPDDTLLVVTAPDLIKASQAWRQLPQSQLWNDPALRPFRESFLSKWNENLIAPLERELKVSLSDYTALLQGQLTLALTQNGWRGVGDPPLGLLLLLDTRDKSTQLKTNLADLRKRWSAAGKALRLEKIREMEFMVLTLSTNDVPKTMRKFLPGTPDPQDGGDDSPAKSLAPTQVVIGQVDSLLIIANTTRPVEKIVARLTGGSLPALADVPAFQANHAAFFRDAPLYGWLNVKAFIDTWLRSTAANTGDAEAPNPFDIKPEKIVTAVGLAGVKTVAASCRVANDGDYFQVFIGVPESSRQGLCRILAGEPKDLNVPGFVPNDAVKFQRWRFDGQKTWATLEKMLGDISPQWLSGINMIVQTANVAGKEKDPGFDVRKNLIGNLGDDLIVYEKAPPTRRTPGQDGPALALIASPNPEQLAAALKSVLVFFGQQPGSTPDQREFLGRKIYSASVGNMALPLGNSAAPAGPRKLNYAASGGYLALAFEPALIEEYLRTCDTQGKSLREIPGLSEAAQKVTGPGANWLGYENEVETMRAALEDLRKLGLNTNSAAAAAAPVLPGAMGLAESGAGIQDWLDFSLLPPFERIAKYFSFSVYGGSATSEGLSFRMFVPTPPAAKGPK